MGKDHSTQAETVISPDDVLTEEDLADIETARAEFARGDFVRHEDIDWS